MSNYPLYPTPRTTRSRITDDVRTEAPRACNLDEYLDHLCQIDDPEFAEGYGLPINSLTEDDLRFLRDFILSSAMYVEQLEEFQSIVGDTLCDTSDDFWEAREHAYRIITALLIRHYEYELEG